MDKSPRRVAQESLEAIFTWASRERYTIAQTKWAIKEVLGLHSSFSLQVLNQAATEVDWRLVWKELTVRFSALPEDNYSAYYLATKSAFLATINAMGDWSSEVAEHLIIHGYQGVRANACDCPVARWMFANLDAWFVSVGPMELIIDGIAMDTPGPVGRFVDKFDGAHFPALDTFVTWASV